MIKNIDKEITTNMNLSHFLNDNKMVIINDHQPKTQQFKLPEEF